MNTWRFLPAAVLIGLCLAAPQEEINLVEEQSQPVGTVRPIGLILGTQNTPKPVDCECVPYYQCREGKILDNGIGIIDLRDGFEDDQKKIPCSHYMDVCCQPPNVARKAEEKVLPTRIERKGCGQRHEEGVGFRITGNTNEAQFGEFPWMVAILKERNIGPEGEKMNVYQCGGALIDRRAVLTAAHCVRGSLPSQLKIRVGEWDTQTRNEVFPHQDRDVESVITHDGFHSGALYNDYAILILTEPVNFEENVDVICLPDENTVYNGSECFVSGWGRDKFGNKGSYQVILKKIGLPLVPHDDCQIALRQTRLGKYFTLHETFICAGGESGKDACTGDGGSPLVCPLVNNPTRYVQVGIVAWGIGCGEGVPGVYANVPYIRGWIDQQLISNNLNNTAYRYEN